MQFYLSASTFAGEDLIHWMDQPWSSDHTQLKSLDFAAELYACYHVGMIRSEVVQVGTMRSEESPVGMLVIAVVPGKYHAGSMEGRAGLASLCPPQSQED